ncbi:high-affinity choline uptake protein BetT [Vibrio astriarenae]|nr:high-affinity choline uptake protein BetT [Vibrio sp. C7]
MGMFVENVGEYASSLLSKTFNLYAYEQTNWIGGWTVFYWAWWFAWCPFVGMFIARISRGRTIREFVFGVLLIPTGFVALWMSVFGNSAISMILDDGLTIVADQVANNTSIALFIFLQQLPFSGISQIVALFLILVFFVTSADSGALVMNLLCTNGSKNPPNWMRVFWTAAIGSISFVLLYAGGLSSLQTMTIVSALPISIVLMVAIYGLFKVLVVDLRRIDSRSFTDCMPQTASNDWREKVNYLFRYKSRHEVSVYLSNTVSRALEEVAEQINEVNRNSDISADIEIAEQKWR